MISINFIFRSGDYTDYGAVHPQQRDQGRGHQSGVPLRPSGGQPLQRQVVPQWPGE